MIRANINVMESRNEKIFSYVTEIKNLEERVEQLRTNMKANSYGSATPEIKKKLKQIHTKLDNERLYMNKLGNRLETISVKYQNAEIAIIEAITGKDYESVTKDNNDVDKSAAKKKTKDKYSKSTIDYDKYKKTNQTSGSTAATGGSTATTGGSTSVTGKTNAAGINLIKECEGFRDTAYQPAGEDHSKYPMYTIGYGHYGVSAGTKWTKEQAEAQLVKDLQKYEKLVDKYMSIYHWNENQYSALVSFCYNIGNIDQLTANGTRSNAQIAEKMLLYVKSGSNTLPGLVKRRQAERALFLKAV